MKWYTLSVFISSTHDLKVQMCILCKFPILLFCVFSYNVKCLIALWTTRWQPTRRQSNSPTLQLAEIIWTFRHTPKCSEKYESCTPCWVDWFSLERKMEYAKWLKASERGFRLWPKRPAWGRNVQDTSVCRNVHNINFGELVCRRVVRYYAPAHGALSDDAVWRLSDVCRVHPVGGRRVRPAGWMARIGWADRAPLGWPGSRLPLQASVAGLGGSISWRPPAYSLFTVSLEQLCVLYFTLSKFRLIIISAQL